LPWTILGVAERLAGHRNAIDPRLERGRDAEVVHRRTDHDDIAIQELFERALAVDLRAGIGAGQGVAGEMGDRVGVEVTVIHGDAGHRVLPTRDNRRAELAGDGVGAQGAGVEVQQFHGHALSGRGDAASWANLGCCRHGINIVKYHYTFHIWNYPHE
jgi:hypothetical protein